MKKILLCLLVCTLHIHTKAQNTSLDRIIVKIDNQIITESDLTLNFLQLVADKQVKNTPDAKCQVLRGMAINKLFMAKAEIDSVVVADALIDLETDQRIASLMNGITIEEIEKRYGKKLDVLKSELRQSLKEQKIAGMMRERITKNTEVTPNEVRKFFERIPTDSLPMFPKEVEVGQIVKIPQINREEKLRIKNNLIEIRKRIVDKGEKFEDLAKLYCEDGSREKGGDLDWQKRGNFVAEFEAVVFRMKPGELSGVIETQFGYHIIKLIARRGDEFNCKHILMMPDWTKVETEPARLFLDSLAQRIRTDSIKFEKAAALYSDDKGANSMQTSSNGGYISAPDGSRRVAMQTLDSFVFFAIDTMTVGNISAPLSYRTQDGKMAYRILYLRKRHATHQADLKQDYTRLYQATLNEKRNQILLKWFRKAKDDVFIDIDPEYKGCNFFGETE